MPTHRCVPTRCRYVLASFHGDTDGLATAPALAAVHAVAARVEGSCVIFGLDANTYVKAKPGKQAAATEFAADFTTRGFASSHGDAAPDAMLTTSNARTFLQPQLQKACKAADKKAKGDFNPKDWILFSSESLVLAEAGRDNTGKRVYAEDLVVPTIEWPSDHGLLFATIERRQVDNS
jgi:hypothetical protein